MPESHLSLLNDLSKLQVFVAVVETQSFTEAGRRLGIVPSTVSKKISSLEERINGQLVIRNTQRLSITELGNQFYEKCLAILHDVEEAENLLGEYSLEPQGLLRVSAATVLSTRHLMPIFSEFLEKNPQVRMDLSLTTVSENLFSEGIDVAIRISKELDPNLIAVKLAPNYRVYCASPGYLEKHGHPSCLEELENHNCLLMRNERFAATWPMRHADGVGQDMVVKGNFVTNNGDMMRQALLAGGGIGHLALFMVHDHIASGELIELFPESRTIASHIYIVFPKRKSMPLKTRAFIDHVRDSFRSAIPWAEPDYSEME